MKILKLKKEEKKVFVHLMISAFFYGFFLSFILIKEIIARKALDATDFQLSLLVMIFPVTSVFSIWWGKLLERTVDKSKYFLLISLFGRLLLACGLIISNMNQFLILSLIIFIFHSSYIPARNSIYQKKIYKFSRGKIFGITLSITTLISMIFSYIAGRTLDFNENFFKYVLFIIAFMGFFDSLILFFIKNKSNKEKKKVKFYNMFIDPLKRSWEILKRNNDFRRFEIGFMIYGMGFLMMMLAVPIFLVDIMKFNYTTSFLAKAVVAQIGLFLLAPFMGYLHDRFHPTKFTIFSFGMLILYPFILLISQFFDFYNLQVVIVFIGFFIFGVARAADTVVWNMGSVYFAKDEDSSMYQSIHVTLMGIRGIIAPMLSVLIKKMLNTNGIFIFSSLFFLAASMYSLHSYKLSDYYIKLKGN